MYKGIFSKSIQTPTCSSINVQTTYHPQLICHHLTFSPAPSSSPGIDQEMTPAIEPCLWCNTPGTGS